MATIVDQTQSKAVAPADSVVYRTPAEVIAAITAGRLDAAEAAGILERLADNAAKAAAAAAERAGMAKASAGCTVTRDEFRQHAVPVDVLLGDKAMAAKPKEFSTGNFGWHAGGKLDVLVNGKPVKCQVGIVVTAIGSKDAG